VRASQPIHSRRTPLRRLASRNAQQLFRSDALLLGRVTYEGFKRENRGDILMYGSAMLGQTLVEHDLIDEIRLMVHPVIVGRGQRLLADGVTTKMLRLVDTTPIGSGIVMMRYEPVR
jgi:dihydrofolate reductase